MKRPCFRKGNAGLEGVLMCYPDSCDSWKSMLDLFFHHYEVMALERKILLPDSAIFIFKPYNHNTCHESDNIVCDQDFSLFLQETFPTWTHTSTWKIPKVTGKFGKKQHQFGSPESLAIAAKKVLNQSLSFCALGALDHSSRVRGFKKSDPWRGSIEVACIDSLSFALKLAQMPNRSDQAIGF